MALSEQWGPSPVPKQMFIFIPNDRFLTWQILNKPFLKKKNFKKAKEYKANKCPAEFYPRAKLFFLTIDEENI